jgi:hypothetical protein
LKNETTTRHHRNPGAQGPFPESPRPDLKAFRSHCHTAARSVGAALLDIEDPHDAFQMRNYAAAHFVSSDRSISCLLNLIFPILAFVNFPNEGQIVFEYTDAPNLSKAFSDFGICTIPSAEELNRPLIQDMWTELAAAEQKRIRYFRPKRVGDVIFNFWD